ncbi:MAG: carboxypeptidase-like regulatory domain-containing protein [Bacteroidales bacterium]
MALSVGINCLFAQTKQITGRVTSADDGFFRFREYRSRLKGTTTGTITNVEGTYSLTVPENEVLVFSFVGMKPKEVPITGQTVYNVVLETETIGVGRVVVTAMGIRREKKSHRGIQLVNLMPTILGMSEMMTLQKHCKGKVAGSPFLRVLVHPEQQQGLSSGFHQLPGATSHFMWSMESINNSYSSGNATENSMNVNAKVDFGNSAADINPADIKHSFGFKGCCSIKSL